MRRSMLFIPGNAPGLLINGNYLGADALIFDLEDAVAPEEKDAARILVRNTLKYMDFQGCETIVRINALDTEYWKADLEEVLKHKPDLIILPKAGTEEEIRTADYFISELESKFGHMPGSVGIMALIETAKGLENAYAIAGASQRVMALFLGAEDLTADLRCQRTREGREIEYARSRLVSAARAAGIDAYDTPFTDVADDEGIRSDALSAKALGFSGKAAISPRHVSVINDVFSPSPDEVNYAYEVMEVITQAQMQGKGAVALRGKMIDAPIVARARQVIAMAEEMGAGR